MFINEEEINFEDFQNMCRTCLKNNNLKSIQNNFLIELLHNITDINYRIDVELPQNICDICIKKIHEIQAFAFQCIEIDLTLRKCRNTFKKNINETETNEEIIIKEEPKTEIEFYEIKDLTFDENVIEIETAAAAETNCGNYEKWFEKTNDVNYSYVAFAKTDNETDDDAQSDSSTNLNIIETEDVAVDQLFFNQTREVQHHRNHHRPPEKNELQCEICQICYKTKNAFSRHRKLFTGPHFGCDICRKIYTNVSGLRMHQKTHKYSGAFICGVCNKMYYKRRNLRYHQRKVHKF